MAREETSDDGIPLLKYGLGQSKFHRRRGMSDAHQRQSVGHCPLQGHIHPANCTRMGHVPGKDIPVSRHTVSAFSVKTLFFADDRRTVCQLLFVKCFVSVSDFSRPVSALRHFSGAFLTACPPLLVASSAVGNHQKERETWEREGWLDIANIQRTLGVSTLANPLDSLGLARVQSNHHGSWHRCGIQRPLSTFEAAFSTALYHSDAQYDFNTAPRPASSPNQQKQNSDRTPVDGCLVRNPTQCQRRQFRSIKRGAVAHRADYTHRACKPHALRNSTMLAHASLLW